MKAFLAILLVMIIAVVIGKVITSNNSPVKVAPASETRLVIPDPDYEFEVTPEAQPTSTKPAEAAAITSGFTRLGGITGTTLKQASVSVVRPTLQVKVLEERIASEAKLVSSVYEYTDEAVVSNSAQLFGASLEWGWTTDTVRFTFKGRINLGIDLSQVEMEVNDIARTVSVKLPAAQIVSHEIDSTSFVFAEEHDSWFASIPPQLFVACADSMRACNEEKCLASDALAKANEAAEETLRGLLADLIKDYELTFTTQG